MHSPKVSLCMIVKNESRLIRQCLTSAIPFVEQMIVVDTGSDDQTMDIARSMGAEVYEHPWEGNFSTARNHSLSYAKGQWILILDGDEILDQQSLDLFKQLDLSDDAPEAYQFKIVNFTTDEAKETEASFQDQVRLFKRTDQHAYDGLVHNQLMNLEEQRNLDGPVVNVRVLHYGYTPSVWQAQGKDQRLALLQKAIKENPQSAFAHYNLGNHLKILKQYREALLNFMCAIPEADAQCEELSVWQRSSCFLGAFCANQIKEYDMAIQLCDLILHIDPYLIDAHVRKVEALQSLGQYQTVIDQLSTVLIHPQRYAIKQKSLHFYAPYRLASALLKQKHYVESLALFMSLSPDCSDITVYTHLSIVACYTNEKDIYMYARQQGDLLDSHDIDWPAVDRLYQHTTFSNQHTSLPSIQCMLRGSSAHVYQKQLQTSHTSWLTFILDMNQDSTESSTISCAIDTHNQGAQLTFYLGDHLLYTAPATLPSPHYTWHIVHMIRIYLSFLVS